MPASDHSRGLLLNGLDGSNPLGFLAAVGTLRTVSLTKPGVDWRMHWRIHGSTWTPVILSRIATSARELTEELARALHRESTPEFDFSKNLNVSPEAFGKVAREAQHRASIQDRRHADFVASYGCEVLATRRNKKIIQDTALRTMRGAGHQHFLGTMKRLVNETKAEHLRKSLFQSWDYSDDKLGLRWDPEEDRRHALRWDNPSNDAPKTVRGANRLAVEALPLLPTAPGARQLVTTGFSHRDGVVSFTWPIWPDPLSLEVVRSLLALSELREKEPDRARLHAIGIVEVYRSERINVEQYRNFTRALPA